MCTGVEVSCVNPPGGADRENTSRPERPAAGWRHAPDMLFVIAAKL